MADPTNIDRALWDELAAVADAAGVELVHVEFKGGMLRLVIDRPDGGVSVDDCATVSRQVSALLDVVDFGPSHYVLEVTSPGLDRPLYRPEDYGRFVGRLARFTVLEPEGGKRTEVGRLEGYDPDRGVVSFRKEEGQELVELPLAIIDNARLEIEL
jgi:ribosome maturation factor RimP